MAKAMSVNVSGKNKTVEIKLEIAILGTYVL
jgi:hypothetical protein